MAKFKLTDFIDIGTHGFHTATSWKVTRDNAGNDIIDESLNDGVNLYNWVSMLPDGNGGYHADLNELHLWVKVHILETASPWFHAAVVNQNDQSFTITENNSVVGVVNSLVAGIG